MTSEFQVRPDNFGAMVAKNRQAPPHEPPFQPDDRGQVEAVAKGAKIVDTRVPSAFGAAYLGRCQHYSDTVIRQLAGHGCPETDIIIVTTRLVPKKPRAFTADGYDRRLLGDGISAGLSYCRLITCRR